MSQWITSPSAPGGVSGGENWIVNQIPTGAIDGSNLIFIVADLYYAGTMMVYLRNLRKTPGIDFTETATGFNFIEPPETGDVIICDYRKM